MVSCPVYQQTKLIFTVTQAQLHTCPVRHGCHSIQNDLSYHREGTDGSSDRSLTGAPYWWTACYSVPINQAGCNGRVTSPPFFFFFIVPCIGCKPSLQATSSWPLMTRMHHGLVVHSSGGQGYTLSQSLNLYPLPGALHGKRCPPSDAWASSS